MKADGQSVSTSYREEGEWYIPHFSLRGYNTDLTELEDVPNHCDAGEGEGRVDHILCNTTRFLQNTYILGREHNKDW